ncbi:MAG TPA: AAA family ATPase [Bryobacteraceae bacterium]|nr:AAA family ATPase [Bryobacteraceae bacterium]
MAVLTIFAGPNGSGKSSIIRRIDFVGRDNLLEADAIATRIRASSPQLAAIMAGREVLRRTQEYVASGQDFAIETTLSGIWTTRAINQALMLGFFVRLVYICLDSAEKSIQRVHERVAQGGHDVPDDDVRRRYARSLSNAKKVLSLVHETIIYDNSGPEPTLIVEIRSGRVVTKASELPLWASELIQEILP